MLFEKLGQTSSLPDRNVMAGYVQQLRNDPVRFLGQMGYKIPQGMDITNPNTLVNYLMQSGQVNSGLLAKAQSLLTLFR